MTEIVVTRMHKHNLREYRFTFPDYGIGKRVYAYNVRQAIKKIKADKDYGSIRFNRVERTAQ